MPGSALTESLRDLVPAKRVFGDPVHADGVVVVPVAVVLGGGGLGGGSGNDGEAGEGGGIALRARPVGAFVIEDGTVRWRPALDLDRLVAWVGIAVLTYVWRRSRDKRR